MNPVLIGIATLYTFSTMMPGKLVKVVRITDSYTDDWIEWPKRYRRTHAATENCIITECIEISRVEIVDERTGSKESP